jgi:nucleoside-diphosphate-sugar epimerase
MTKTRRVLGFEAKTDLVAGLDKTLPWCRERYGAAGSRST